MSYIEGYEGAGVYETVTWRDGHESEKKNSIILTELDVLYRDVIVEYSESNGFTAAVIPNNPSKVVKKLDTSIFDFLFAQQNAFLLFDIGRKAIEFTQEEDLQIDQKAHEKMHQIFEFMKNFINTSKTLTDLEIKSIFPDCKNQAELSSLLFREFKKMFYTNFETEKQSLFLMSAKIGGAHLAKNFLMIESEIKQSIAEGQPLGTIMTKFAISISKLNLYTNNAVIKSVAAGKTELIELIFAACNHVPLQARVQLRYFFYFYLDKLQREQKEGQIITQLTKDVGDYDGELEIEALSGAEGLSGAELYQYGLQLLQAQQNDLDEDDLDWSDDDGAVGYDGALAVKFSFRH